MTNYSTRLIAPFGAPVTSVAITPSIPGLSMITPQMRSSGPRNVLPGSSGDVVVETVCRSLAYYEAITNIGSRTTIGPTAKTTGARTPISSNTEMGEYCDKTDMYMESRANNEYGVADHIPVKTNHRLRVSDPPTFSNEDILRAVETITEQNNRSDIEMAPPTQLTQLVHEGTNYSGDNSGGNDFPRKDICEIESGSRMWHLEPEGCINRKRISKNKQCSNTATKIPKSEYNDPGTSHQSNGQIDKVDSPLDPATCPIHGCSKRAKYDKSHFLKEHAPSIFRYDSTYSIAEKRLKALAELSKMIFGPYGDRTLLLRMLKQHESELSKFTHDINHYPEVDKLKRMCRQCRWHIPQKFSLSPINSPALLCYPPVLSILVQCLSERQQITFKHMYPFPFEKELDKNDKSLNCANAPANDSGFNLHDLIKKFKRPEFSLEYLFKRVGMAPKQFTVNIEGGLAIFSNSKAYPLEVEIELYKKHNILTCIGMVNSEDIQLFEDCIKRPGVVGIGIAYIDHSRPPQEWPAQDELLELYLSMLTPKYVLHIQCNGMESDPTGYEAYMRCLSILMSKVLPSQRIQLHNFNGSEEMVKLWLEYFPSTYFGFSLNVATYTSSQRNMIKHIPCTNFLLETNAPDNSPSDKYTVNSPHLIGFVAAKMHEILGLPIDIVLKTSSLNFRALYRLDAEDDCVVMDDLSEEENSFIVIE